MQRTGKYVFSGLLLVLIALGSWLVIQYFRVESFISQAEHALKKQQYAKALHAYEQALEYRPDNPSLHLLTARTARRNGEVYKARHHLTRCRELQAGVTEELQLEEYLFRAQTGELNKVHNKLLPYLIKEGPQTPLVLEALVRVYLETYQLHMVLPRINRWLELEPHNAEAWFRRGIWYSLQTDELKAMESFKKAIELDPERVAARMALAEHLMINHELEEARQQYQAVLQYDPDNSHARLWLAQIYAEVEQTDTARKMIESVKVDKENQAEVALVRGMVHMKDRQFSQAEKLFRDALKMDPKLQKASYNLMICLNALGRKKEAQEQKQQLAQLEQDQIRLTALTSGELIKSPNDPSLRCELGDIFFRFGKPSQGLAWYQKALSIAPNYKPVHERLLEYYEKQPEERDKAEFHRQALKNLQE